MTSIATQRALGWADPGAPGSVQEANWKRQHLVKAGAVPVVKTVWVHESILPMANALLLFLQKNGAHLGQRVDDWGFANRAIRGFPGSMSYHRWARAIDADAVENAQRSKETTFPINKTNEVAGLVGAFWGRNFNMPWSDPMHFEWRISRLRAKWIRSRLNKPTKRSRRLAALCGMDVDDFIKRIHRRG